jgi:hypothetical protein
LTSVATLRRCITSVACVPFLTLGLGPFINQRGLALSSWGAAPASALDPSGGPFFPPRGLALPLGASRLWACRSAHFKATLAPRLRSRGRSFLGRSELHMGNESESGRFLFRRVSFGFAAFLSGPPRRWAQTASRHWAWRKRVLGSYGQSFMGDGLRLAGPRPAQWSTETFGSSPRASIHELPTFERDTSVHPTPHQRLDRLQSGQHNRLQSLPATSWPASGPGYGAPLRQA